MDPNTLEDAITALEAAEAAQSTEVAAVLRYVAGVPKMITDAVAAAQAANATSDQMVAAINGVASKITADTDRMKAALAAPPAA